MGIDHNRIKVSDLETNEPNKILATNSDGKLEFTDLNFAGSDSYNALDYTLSGKSLDARQGKILKDLINIINTVLASDNLNLNTLQKLADTIESVQNSLSSILVNDLTTGGITKALTAEMGKALQNSKVDKVSGKSLLSDSEITRLGALSNYTHPANHPASIITQDANNKFVTDAEKATWNAKQTNITAGTNTQYFRGDKSWQTLDKSAIDLANTDNTADATKNVLSATKLTTAKTINGIAFDGTANITINAVDSTPRIALSEKGIANGVATLDASGIIVTAQLPTSVNDILEYTNLAGFPVTGLTGKIYIAKDTNKMYRWSGTAYVFITSGGVDSVAGKNGAVILAKTDVGLANVDNTADTAKNVLSATKLTTARTINGIVFDGSANITINAVDSTPSIGLSEKGAANGVATLDASGIIPTTQLPSYVDDVLEYANLAAFPATGEAGKIYVAKDTNKTYRWGGTAYVFITSGAVDSVAGKTGVVSLAKADVGLSSVDNTADAVKNVFSATKLTTSRTINGITFDGTANITITDSSKENNIAAGSVNQYFRGDKTWQTLDKTTIGLGNIDNTADTSKNVLSAAKLTTARTINGIAFDGTANISIPINNTDKVPHQDGTRSDLNYNAALNSGFYNVNSTGTNGPGSSYNNLITVKGIDTGLQIAGGYITDSLWFRGWGSSGSTFTPWRKLLHDGNYNSYSPTLTGAGASGTWGINITGSASGSAKYVDLLPNRTDVAAYPILWGVNQATNPVTGNSSTYAFSCEAVKIQSSTGTIIANNFSGSGTGLTGTAGSLNIGGNATTSNRISFADGPRTLSDRLPNSFTRSVNFDFVNSGTIGGSGNYGGVMTFAPWDGLSASTGDSSYQVAFRNESGVNGSGLPGLRLRKGIDTSWGGWYDILHSGNYSVFSAFSGAITGASLTVTGDVTAFSDERVKENIRPITNAIERIQASRGVVYDRIDTHQKDNIGFIAQELEENFPELVLTREDGTKAVKYQNAVAVLFEAIKEQQSQIQELKGLVTKLLNHEFNCTW